MPYINLKGEKSHKSISTIQEINCDFREKKGSKYHKNHSVIFV